MASTPTAPGATVGDAKTWTMLLLAVSGVGGLLGSFMDDGGDSQIILYSLASLAGLGAASLLAVRHVRAGRDLAAAGFGALAIVTGTAGVAGFAGPGADSVFASMAILWLPALWLIAFQDWSPTWTRGAAALSGLAFAIYGYTTTLGDDGPDVDDPILMGAWVLFIVAIVGWIVTVKDEG